MARPLKHPLRALTASERALLEALARSRNAPADRIARAKELLAVAEGAHLGEAVLVAGRCCRQALAELIVRFNEQGMEAVWGHHGGVPALRYGPEEQSRILKEFARTPDREKEGTATWSWTTLQKALRKAPDGLPTVSTYVILQVLHQAGYTWQKDRTGCHTATVERKRKEGTVHVTDPEATPQKGAIEQAYPLAEKAGIPVWCEDEAGPYQAIPQAGTSWQKDGDPDPRSL